MKKVLNFFSLFGSVGTLICCALPALFVSLGAGAVFAAVLVRVPQLIWVSEHKAGVFAFAGAMLALGGFAQWNARNQPCPLDAAKAEACESARKASLRVYFVSLVIFLTGAGFAFLPGVFYGG
jgi:hypothetical protein